MKVGVNEGALKDKGRGEKATGRRGWGTGVRIADKRGVGRTWGWSVVRVAKEKEGYRDKRAWNRGWGVGKGERRNGRKDGRKGRGVGRVERGRVGKVFSVSWRRWCVPCEEVITGYAAFSDEMRDPG